MHPFFLQLCSSFWKCFLFVILFFPLCDRTALLFMNCHGEMAQRKHSCLTKNKFSEKPETPSWPQTLQVKVECCTVSCLFNARTLKVLIAVPGVTELKWVWAWQKRKKSSFQSSRLGFEEYDAPQNKYIYWEAFCVAWLKGKILCSFWRFFPQSGDAADFRNMMCPLLQVVSILMVQREHLKFEVFMFSMQVHYSDSTRSPKTWTWGQWVSVIWMWLTTCNKQASSPPVSWDWLQYPVNLIPVKDGRMDDFIVTYSSNTLRLPACSIKRL